MKILYQRTPTFKWVGIIFLMIGLAYSVIWALSGFIFFYLIPIAFLNFLIGGFHYLIHLRFYLICNSDQLLIRSNLFFLTSIKVADLIRFDKEKNQFTLHYGNKKKKRIYYKFLSIEDRSRVEAYLIEKTNIQFSESTSRNMSF